MRRRSGGLESRVSDRLIALKPIDRGRRRRHFKKRRSLYNGRGIYIRLLTAVTTELADEARTRTRMRCRSRSLPCEEHFSAIRELTSTPPTNRSEICFVRRHITTRFASTRKKSAR